MFNNDDHDDRERNYDDDRKELEKNTSGGKGVIVLLVIVFLPAALLAFIIGLLLKKFKQRLSVIFGVMIMLQLILVGLWFIFDPLPQATDFFMNISDFKENWTQLLPLILIVNGIIGSIAGFFYCSWEVRQMKLNPHRLQLPGSWMYKFEYRRTPKELFNYRKKISNLKAGVYASTDKAPIGIDETINKDSIVYRYNTEAQKHTLIAGNTGSGKTITMLSLVKNDIMNNMPLVLIDFKRSPEFASKLAKWTKEYGGNFYHFVNGNPKYYDVEHSSGQSFYDPLSGGSATSKADMVLGMREYDTASAVYKSNMQQLLQILFSMLYYADRSKAPSIDWDSGGIYQLATAVSDGNITELASACEGTPIEKDAEALDLASRGKTGLKHAMDELQGQVRTIVASEYGRWMKTSKSGSIIDLFKLTQEPGNVILFSLNSDSEPEFARYVGSMILADLTATSAKRRNAGMKNQVNVYIDEFQAVNPDSVTSLLEKSRESRIAMTLAQQSFEQIVAASDKNGEAYLLSVLDTCSNFIIHNGSTEDSATRLSKILGKEWVTTYKASNKNENFLFSMNWYNRRNQTVQTIQEERWVFEPREFMQLSSPDAVNNFKASAIFINKTSADPAFKNKSGATARRVWMIPDNEVIQEYYVPKFRDSEDVYERETTEESTPVVELSSSVVDDGPVPQSIDPLEEYRQRKKMLNDSSSEFKEFDSNDDVEDDGDFSFEVIDDEDQDNDLQQASRINMNNVNEVNESNNVARKHERKRITDSTSFDSLFKSNHVPQTLPKNNAKVNEKVKESKGNESSRGELPDLNDFSLPDL